MTSGGGSLLLAGALLTLFAPGVAAQVAEVAYVASDVLNERLCPGTDCPSTNKVYRGQKLEVFERKDGWARVSKYYDSTRERIEFPQVTSPTVARWVAEQYLSADAPEPLPQPVGDAFPADPRIQGIPAVGEYGLKERDVSMLRRYAAQLIASGECSGVEYGDRSVSKAGVYYVQCAGEQENRFFTASDVR